MIDAHLHLWDLQRSRYGWITPELGPLARQSVLAHLIKLENDGLARCRDGRWLLVA